MRVFGVALAAIALLAATAALAVDPPATPAVACGQIDDVDPAWSRSGTIAFVRMERGSRHSSIYTIPATGGSARSLVSDLLWVRRPTWSPDGKLLAFEGTDVDGNNGVYVVGTGGTDERKIAAIAVDPQLENLGLTWSPDAAKIAYVGGSPGAHRIFVVKLDGSGAGAITSGPDDVAPSWSPTGRAIAFLDGGQLAVVDPNGANRRVLANDVHSYDAPTWSPDGRRLAYTGGFDVVGSVQVVAADGSAAREVDEVGNAPQWSPDGTAIADYTATEGYTREQIDVTSPDSGSPRAVTHDNSRLAGAEDTDPRWSPDSRALVFVAGADGPPEELRVVDRDGLHERRLTYHCLIGTARADNLDGTWLGDIIRGGGGDDLIRGFGGNDRIDGGPGRDRIIAGAGDDVIRVRDGQRDVVNCGSGFDVVIADRRDEVGRSCERVRR